MSHGLRSSFGSCRDNFGPQARLLALGGRGHRIGYHDGMSWAAGAILSRRQGVDSRALSDGAVLVDMTTGNCFELNRIGAEIWELLAPGASEETICAALAERYPVERAVLVEDLRRLLEELQRHGLVVARA